MGPGLVDLPGRPLRPRPGPPSQPIRRVGRRRGDSIRLRPAVRGWPPVRAYRPRLGQLTGPANDGGPKNDLVHPPSRPKQTPAILLGAAPMAVVPSCRPPLEGREARRTTRRHSVTSRLNPTTPLLGTDAASGAARLSQRPRSPQVAHGLAVVGADGRRRPWIVSRRVGRIAALGLGWVTAAHLRRRSCRATFVLGVLGSAPRRGSSIGRNRRGAGHDLAPFRRFVFLPIAAAIFSRRLVPGGTSIAWDSG